MLRERANPSSARDVTGAPRNRCCNRVAVMLQRRCRKRAELFDGRFPTLASRTATRLVCVAKE